MSAPAPSFPQPIFVGGSARSGSHALGRLLGTHPRYALLEVEARFHGATGGLCDLLTGNTDLDSFTQRCLGMWWQRGLKQHRGLHVIIGRRELEAALGEFGAAFDAEPWEASRRLVRAVLDPAAERAGKPAWVDLSGSNIKSAPTLVKLFPRAKFIHMVRDGRAVAAAILRKRDMTDDLRQALGHWETRIRRSHAGLSDMPPGSVLTILLDDLTAHDRERTYARLVGFLEIEDDRPIRRHFDRTISADRAHVGRWRQRIAPADARWVDRRYRKLVRQMRREGIDWIPEPE